MDPDGVDGLRRSADGAVSDDGGSSIDADGRARHGGADDAAVLDFSANANPERPDGVAGVYEAALAAAGSYPDGDYAGFRRAAAAAVDCDPDDVVPTPGGMAAIRLAVATTVESGESALLPAPSFGEYAREVRLQGGEPAFVDHDAVLDADPSDHALAVVCHPNNPTGTAYDAERLRAFAERCRAAGTPLLVDEAFLGFTERPSLTGAPGVIVARSLTKLFGLPGLRAGYAVATGDLGDRLATARRPWALGAPAAAVGEHCLRDRAFVARTRERVAHERERVRERLRSAYEVPPSAANFLLVDAGSSAAVEDLLDRVASADLAVRDARTFRGLDSHVRIGIRRPGENDRLLAALGV